MWRLPSPARAFLLTAEIAAVGLTVLLLAAEDSTTSTLFRFGLLVVLGVGYSEVASHSTRMQRYLGTDTVFSNPMSVWSCAAVLTVPAGWAASFIAVRYAHAMWQRRRDASGTPYRVVFTAAAAMLAQLTAAAVINLGGPHGHTLANLAALAGVVLFLLVDLLILLTGMWLTARPPSIRRMLPDADSFGYELGTVFLGLAAAEFVLHAAVLTPATVVLVALLHRSSVVKSLQKSARTDSKTGLLTAAAWADTANATLRVASDAGRSVALLVIDLDHFKAVNDTFGHLHGDRVLAAVAACLRRELRGHDGLGRFGGEEFVAILDGPTLIEALAVADRLRAAISRLRVHEALQVTASIGVAHTGALPVHCSLEALIDRADCAMYDAKQAGRNRVRLAALTA